MAGTFVIGDIHGAFKALQQLIERINLQENDQLIFLGDYVDGWSQSAEVIDFLMALEKQRSCIFLKGNHDAWCEAWLAGETPEHVWLMHGGISTVESYRRLTDRQKATHLAFFRRMQSWYIDDQNRLFIHAGFASMHGPARERYGSNFLWDRTLWETARTLDPRLKKTSLLYPQRLLLYKEIFIGHSPTINYDVFEPMHCANVWNIDTGAGFYGPLSALNVDTCRIFQSDVVRTLYPGEKGRNP